MLLLRSGCVLLSCCSTPTCCSELCPEGIQLKSTPEDRDIDTRFGRFRLAVDSSRPGVLVLERLFEMKKNRVPLAEYQEFRKLSASVDQLSNEKIVLRKTGK